MHSLCFSWDSENWSSNVKLLLWFGRPMLWFIFVLRYVQWRMTQRICSLNPWKVIVVFKRITNNLKDNSLLRCDNTNNILWKDPIIVELSINSTKPCHDLNKIGGQPKSIFGSSLLTTICLDKFVIETLRLNT